MWKRASRRAGLRRRAVAQPIPPAEFGGPAFCSVFEQLELECRAMVSYALKQGMAMSPDLPGRLAELRVMPGASLHGESGARELASLHRQLVRAIHPATPQAVVLIERERLRGGWLRWLGPIPLIRTLTLTSVGCLASVVGLAMSSLVNAHNITLGFLDSSGSTLGWNVMFILACAGLGAAFSALFQAHRYVADATYDPRFDSSYAARMILGLIAGLILVELLPENLFAESSLGAFGKPALAMMGGFSASAVYRLLQRMVEVMETVVRGDSGQQSAATIQSQRASAEYESIRARGELAAGLLDLQREMQADPRLDQVRQQLTGLARQMMSDDS